MGVDFSRFPPAAPEERAAARASYSLPEDAVCLVCAAEFSKRKNQTLLLQTLSRLPENYYLLLPGDGALLEESGAGYLVPFGDAAAFAEAVQTLGRDAALRARMGAAANESTEKYALDRVLPEGLPHFTRH